MSLDVKAPLSNRNPRRDSNRLSSVTTAIHLLKTFTQDESELGISELAKRLRIAKSTVHRLATALLDEGLLEQNPDNGRYRLGIGLFSLGSQVRSRMDVAGEAKPLLNDLRQRCGENVRLAILERRAVVFVHDFESNQAVRLRSITGQDRPVHCTAEGMAVLSGLREAQLEEFLAEPLEPRTESTITDAEVFREKIHRIKRQGYAVEDEECEEGTRAIAAPVFQADGRVVAAVGIAGPRLRVRKSEFPGLGAMAMETAQALSARLGYHAGQPLYVRSI